MALFKQQDEDFEHMDWQSKAMSEEEFHKLEDLSPDRKYEYIYGKVYMMSGGTRAHDQIRRNLERTLEDKLEGSPCTLSGVDLQVLLGIKSNNRKHFVYPEATVSCNPADFSQSDIQVKSPRVVFEVLSNSTESKDRGV